MEITLQKLIELGADKRTQDWFESQFGNSAVLKDVLERATYFGNGNILHWLKANIGKNIVLYREQKVIDFSHLPKDVDYIVFWTF